MKIVHSADWQLGWAQYGLRSRLRDFEVAADNIFRLALEQKARALILAGDIFDTNRPPARSVELVRRGVAKLAANGCATVGILGNHDISEQDDPNQSDWLQICGVVNVHGKSVVLTGDDDEQVMVAGVDRRRPGQLLEELRADKYRLVEPAKATAAGKVPVIMVLHQILAEVSPFGSEGLSAVTLAEILGPMGVQYVAMGDVHEYRYLEAGGVKFCYPGSTEMTDIDEPRQKGAVVIDITDGQLAASWAELPSRKIVKMRIDKEEDLEQLRAQVAAGTVNGNTPLLYLEVNRELDLVPKLEKWYESFPKCISTYAGAGDMAKVFDKPIWEREGAVLQLGRAVEAFHAAGTDEHQLILEILRSPDSVEDVMSNYFAQKGLNFNDYRGTP